MADEMMLTETPDAMTPDRNRVKILMLQKDISQVHIVNKYKFDKGDVSKVVHGKRKTRAIQEAIARELEMSVEDVFG